MELLNYKIMTNISSWLRVTKKYRNMPLSNTLKSQPINKSTHTEPTRNLWARLRSTPRTSVISYSRSDVRGSRLNTAQDFVCTECP